MGTALDALQRGITTDAGISNTDLVIQAATIPATPETKNFLDIKLNVPTDGIPKDKRPLSFTFHDTYLLQGSHLSDDKLTFGVYIKERGKSYVRLDDAASTDPVYLSLIHI